MAALAVLATAGLTVGARSLETPQAPPLPPDVGLGPLQSSPAVPQAGEDPVGFGSLAADQPKRNQSKAPKHLDKPKPERKPKPNQKTRRKPRPSPPEPPPAPAPAPAPQPPPTPAPSPPPPAPPPAPAPEPSSPPSSPPEFGFEH